MPEVPFAGLVIVSAVAFVSPFVLGLFPRIRLPAVVLEIVLGIVIGPSVLGWVEDDLIVQVLSVVGLGFLLFVSGLEVELDRLRGGLLRVTALGFLISLGLAILIGGILQGTGQVESALLIAIALTSTSLGLVVPVLKDAGQADADFGQLVIAGATMADFGAVILLPLLFSKESRAGSGRRSCCSGSSSPWSSWWESRWRGWGASRGSPRS
jgi:Kef-type K+ transport system membrane component KefB